MIYVLFWVIVGGLVGVAAGSVKGRAAEGLLLGFVLCFVGWIIVAIMPASADRTARRVRREREMYESIRAARGQPALPSEPPDGSDIKRSGFVVKLRHSVLICLVLLGALVAVSTRSNDPSGVDRTSPYWDRNGNGTGDHIHNAFGVYICDHWASALTDIKPDMLGIHSHGDGLIHIHPFAASASGRNAIMKALSDQVGMTVTASSIEFSGQATLNNGDACPPSADGRFKGGKGEFQVWIWQTPDQKAPNRYLGDPNKIHFDPDRVIAFAFVVPGMPVPEPPSYTRLAAPVS